jgi:crossover junction endodeoxyribonuclease RuvC
MQERLLAIHDGITGILERLSVDGVVLESAFLHRNARTAMALGEVRGVILLASERVGLAVHEYSAAEIKRAAVGYGAADKEQVSRMMCRILGLAGLDEPDATDALATAWCHLSRAARPVVIGAAT